MILHQPEIVPFGTKSKLVSRVEIELDGVSLPSEAYYAYPKKHTDQLSLTNEAFGAALYLVAMHFNQALEIRGTVSPKFAHGLIEFGRIFRMWAPKIFHEVDLKFEHIALPSPAERPRGVATAFSGGVDSHFSVMTNRAAAQPIEDFQLTHGIFVHGMDIDLEEMTAYDSAYRKYAQMFTEFGLELIPVETNTRAFSRFRVDWIIMSGGSLLGAGLGLGGLLRRFFIPSGYSYYRVWMNGNTPITDPLLSTETLDIVHHGAYLRHYEKMAAIAEWPVAHANLRVCTATPKPLDGHNCSRCNKCLANMVRFELLGVHEKFATFQQPFSWKLFPHWWLIAQIGSQAVGEVLELAVEKRRWDIYLGMLGVRMGTWVNTQVRNLFKLFFSEARWTALKQKVFIDETPNKFVRYIRKYL